MSPDPNSLPVEFQAVLDRLLSDLDAVRDSRFKQRAVVNQYLQSLSKPVGLPRMVAQFDNPERTPTQQKEARRRWVQAHHAAIQANLRAGHVPLWDGQHAVAFDISPNIVTRRFAGRIIRDIIAPAAGTPGPFEMIQQYSASARSKYKFIAVNAMGVGTDDGIAATSHDRLGGGHGGTGQGTSPKNQWCWYHLNTNQSGSGNTAAPTVGAGIDVDPTLGTVYGADAYAIDSAGTLQTVIGIAPASVLFKLEHGDPVLTGTGYYSSAADQYEFRYDATWDFPSGGSDGDERYGNFGSDASPNSWREIGLANNAHGVAGDPGANNTDVRPGGAHPDKAFHLATRKVFAGDGFAKTRDVKLTNQYTVRFTAG